MTQSRTMFCLALLVLLLGFTQASAQERALLYPPSVSGKLQEVVASMRQLGR